VMISVATPVVLGVLPPPTYIVGAERSSNEDAIDAAPLYECTGVDDTSDVS